VLATDYAQLKDHYDVLIVGSGYGGAVTAARLGYANHKAGKRLSIAILERGVEYPTGIYPVTATEFAASLKTSLTPLGLFEFVLSPDFAVVQGSGLGGTSLCNGCVCIRPDREVFEQFWPRAIRHEDPPLGEYYQRAEAMLSAIPYADQVELPKAHVFEQMSKAVGGKFGALNLAISNETRITKYDIPRRPCVNCSSCISGCNYESKNTLDKNYLPLAKHFGVEMFTRMEVDSFLKLPGNQGYQVAVMYRTGSRGTQVEWKNIATRRLILAAGCLGTSGIMLRSQTPRLQFSKQLGQRFSGNGDFFALAYNLDQNPNFNGWGIGIPEEFHIKGGPTITTVFHVNQDKPLQQRLTFEEASMPAPFVDTMRNLAFAAAAGQPWKFLNTSAKIGRWFEDRYRNNTGAINSSLLYLGMGFDSARGVIKLDGSRNVTIEWPNAADDEVFKLLSAVTRRATAALGGDQFPNPMLQFNLPLPLSPPYIQKPMTGHPIGGCATADSVDHGVVNDHGRVFDPNGGFHDGLYIIDGSVFPGSIGVNVLLTIAAFAERAADYLRQELGLPSFNKAEEWDDR
jgi:cholesterol oxidase